MAAQRDRGQLIPKGPGKWLLRVFTGRTPDGKRTYAGKKFDGTTVQARVALTAMLREIDTQSFVPNSPQTLGEYLDQWLKGKIDISARTLESYERQLKLVTATLGERKLTALDGAMIQRFVKTLTERNLSPRTIQYTVRILRGALEDAVRRSTLVRNPANYLNLPRKVRRGASVLSMGEVGTLLKKTAGDTYGVLWRLLLTSGMRPQEAFAVMWSDVDLDGAWLSVRRTLVSDGHGKTVLANRVKADSQRRIGLPESTITALRAHKRQQAEEILGAGKHYERMGLVFSNQFGRPLDISRVRRAWKKALKDAKLPEIRLYDTRHTHLTGLLASGVDVALVSARAGHKDISMTVEHYAHVLPESHRQMGEVTERMLRQAETKGAP